MQERPRLHLQNWCEVRLYCGSHRAAGIHWLTLLARSGTGPAADPRARPRLVILGQVCVLFHGQVHPLLQVNPHHQRCRLGSGRKQTRGPVCSHSLLLLLADSGSLLLSSAFLRPGTRYRRKRLTGLHHIHGPTRPNRLYLSSGSDILIKP